MNQQPILLDTNIASIFSEVGKLEQLLAVLYQHPLYISPIVYNELSVGLNRGHTFLRQVLENIDENKQIRIVTLTLEEIASVKILPVWLGSGEAEAIAVCQSRGWIFTSYDRKAVSYCKSKGILTLTLNDILAALWQGNIVSKDEVKEMIRQLETGGRTIRAKAKILKE